MAIGSPALSVDSQFSNVQDINHAEWSRLDPAGAIKTILQEYRKKKSRIKSDEDLEEPERWHT